jgi:hypothetical protein
LCVETAVAFDWVLLLVVPISLDNIFTTLIGPSSTFNLESDQTIFAKLVGIESSWWLLLIKRFHRFDLIALKTNSEHFAGLYEIKNDFLRF